MLHITSIWIPDSHRRVGSCGYQSIFRQSDKTNQILVAFQDCHRLTRIQVPYPYRVVSGSRNASILLHVQDTALNWFVRKIFVFSRYRQSPDVKSRVSGTGNYQRYLREHYGTTFVVDAYLFRLQNLQASDSRGMATKNMGAFSLFHIPDANCSVCSSGGQYVSQVFHCPNTSCMARKDRSEFSGIDIINGDAMISVTRDDFVVVKLQTGDHVWALPRQRDTARLEFGIFPSFGNCQSSSVYPFRSTRFPDCIGDALGDGSGSCCNSSVQLDDVLTTKLDGVAIFAESELLDDDADGDVTVGAPAGKLSTMRFLLGGLDPVLSTTAFVSIAMSVISESEPPDVKPPVLSRFLEARLSVSGSCPISTRVSQALADTSSENGNTESRLMLESGYLIELTEVCLFELVLLGDVIVYFGGRLRCCCVCLHQPLSVKAFDCKME
ncbi:hypothetical protein OGATHE_001964 [Ogataea polymorpha]|uniref:Uncharacterized protein n=1 Tax=Ogataea polymorpha TaxID=460523 RepID=A0A9P8TCS4_9ASCO|nr:hypothetical protein OGATHE_001964 [Ogataea polymorpha]